MLEGVRLLLLVVVVLSVVSSAQAAPEGFRDSTRLTPRMRAISGNPQAFVYCATSAEAYREKRVALGAVGLASAFTVYSENAAYFQAHVCGALERWLRGKPATRPEVGVAALTFAHEAGHLGGERDERTVDCGALAALSTTLRVHFAVKNTVAVREMVAAARARTSRTSYRC